MPMICSNSSNTGRGPINPRSRHPSNCTELEHARRRWEQRPETTAALEALGLSELTADAARRRLRDAFFDALVTTGGHVDPLLTVDSPLFEGLHADEIHIVRTRLARPNIRHALSLAAWRFGEQLLSLLPPPRDTESSTEQSTPERPSAEPIHCRSLPPPPRRAGPTTQ
jgi:hypothetical protein